MNPNSPASVSSQASENNQRLFRRFGKVFAHNDLSAYISHAQKLSVWLRDHKAYYTAARPEIVKLLLIAQITLRRALRIAEQPSVPFKVLDYPGNPMVEAYTMLIKSIEPFQTHFIEPSLIVHIRALLATIPVSPSQTLTGLSQILPAPPSSTASTDTRHAVRDAPSQPENTLLKTDPEVEIVERSHTVPTISQTQAAGAATSTVLSGKAKVKKRKTIDFNLLVQHDIKGLMQKKGAQSAQPSSHGLPDDASKASPPALVNLPSIPGAASIGPTAVSTDAGGNKPTSTDKLAKVEIIEVSLVNEKTATENTDDATSIDQRMQALNMTSLNNIEPSMDTDELSNLVLAVPPVTDLLIQAMDVSGDSINPQRPDGQHASQPPKAFLSGTKEPTPMDVDRPERIGQTLPSNRASQTPPELTVQSTSIQPPVSHGIQFKAVKSSLVSGLIEGDSPSLRVSQMPGIFGPEVCIVARQQGLKQNSKISVQFDMPETQFKLISSWINRSQDISISLCLTLGCYLTSDLLDSAKNANCKTFEAQVSSTRSVWPNNEGLNMSTYFNNRPEELPLSPPFQVTPDNLVDVSPLLVLGANTIELNQRQDLSLYTFILHAHHPTKAQLKQLEERQQKERAWNEWLNHISRPLKLPLQHLVPPTLIA
ncbi:hypothetical protein GALMADRAFT_263661 [Galerina marginata CBS 339.88]|uniref:Uncharacterized protein n=1 Tax=Galerina marginata (strain CBS 339.88) TaxID=685588 RepID=A0A067TDZ8_GALM3|nr:hypothetical protein GALMADRAFT_263661 [Galerina marginata CBS 339.88]